MVRLSDIIRKLAEKKSQNKPGLISEAIRTRNERESMPEMKKLYEDTILRMRLIMNDLKEGKTIEGKQIINIAEETVDRLRISTKILFFLINYFSWYEKERDYYLYAHSVNTSILAANLGIALGYEKSEIVDLCASSLLHDIGILKIPEKIINKPSELTKEEYDLIKKHPHYGRELLNNIEDPPKSASEVVYQHHERINGRGYPEGISGEEISEYAKIVAIAEVYEAITHPRPYHRNIIIPYEGVKMIVQEEKNSFEPRLVKVFLRYITPYPIGSFVLLNTNEIGRVVDTHEDLPLRPVVEIVLNADGKHPKEPKKIDLAKSPILHISKAIDEHSV